MDSVRNPFAIGASDRPSWLDVTCHEMSRPRAPLVVLGAGLPHLPAS